MASIFSVIWHKGVRCPIGVGHDEERGSGMTGEEGHDNETVGHDGEKGSAWYHIVIAWCYRHCRLDRQSLDRQSGGGEMPDRGRA